MDFLRKDRLEKWRAVQPRDVASATEDPVDTDPAFVELVAKRLPTFRTAVSVRDFVAGKAEEFVALGRAGRLRFLAWVLRQKYSDEDEFMIALISDRMAGDDEGDGGGASGTGLERVAPFFYSDLLAFAEAIGPRVAAQIVDVNTLEAVSGASLDVASEFEMKGQM
jgi:hypothetical protein